MLSNFFDRMQNFDQLSRKWGQGSGMHVILNTTEDATISIWPEFHPKGPQVGKELRSEVQGMQHLEEPVATQMAKPGQEWVILA